MTSENNRPLRRILRRFGDLPSVARLRQAGNPIRTENFVENGEYVVRADLPGIDPARDIDVSVDRGQLEIKAIRREDFRLRQERTDISYGLFRRVLRLPDDADSTSLSTRYENGVLRMSFHLPGGGDPTPMHRRPLPHEPGR
ncbi:MAG: Hsp20/alpha crystallin family protein [Streptosporangiaceae bacterium]